MNLSQIATLHTYQGTAELNLVQTDSWQICASEGPWELATPNERRCHTGWRRRGGTGPMARHEMTPEQQRHAAESNCRWLQDAMAVLLVLLVLDRFADYHNDSATAPVRETAAQAIAFAAAASPQAVRQQLLEQLVKLQQSQVWEVCCPTRFLGALLLSLLWPLSLSCIVLHALCIVFCRPRLLRALLFSTAA
jgi:hypothetical protein